MRNSVWLWLVTVGVAGVLSGCASRFATTPVAETHHFFVHVCPDGPQFTVMRRTQSLVHKRSAADDLGRVLEGLGANCATPIEIGYEDGDTRDGCATVREALSKGGYTNVTTRPTTGK